MAKKRALIFGINGQDGAYLAAFLLARGYDVHGTTRNSQSLAGMNLAALGVAEQVGMHQLNPEASTRVDSLLAQVQPDEIYYLAAQSSVWKSFEQPAETLSASALGLASVLSAARAKVPNARLFNAGSGDCFGETSADAAASERSPFKPRSPYAAAKCAGHHMLSVSRLAYDQFACTGFLFNHESPLRQESFAIGKVLAAVRRIRAGSAEKLRLGNVGVVRDWGWAPEYVEAMWMMLQLPAPQDFVIATGKSHSLRELVHHIFAAAGLDPKDHIVADADARRPFDIFVHHADPGLAARELGWRAEVGIEELGERLVSGTRSAGR